MGFFDNWGRPSGSSPGFFGNTDYAGNAMPTTAWSGGPNVLSLGGFSPADMAAPTLPIPDVSSGIGKIPSIGAGGSKMGLNFDTANLALSGLNTIGSLWGAFQAAKLAKQQFKYTKRVTDTNLANQIQTYNTGLMDRANNRAIVEGRSPEQTAAYIDANSLRRYGG